MPGNIARYTLLNRISGEEDFLWQNDYGQKMLITGIELPPSYEVHFANSSRGDSVPELGDSSGVLIPDTVLTSGKPVYFWLFLHVGENDGQTVYGGVINVKPRTALPTVEPPTPAQQSILDELMAAMNNAISHVDDVAEGIPTAIDTALEQAKQSGEFKGDTGAVFTPSVTGAGVISWTNDGGLPNPETVDLGQSFATKDEINGKLDKIEKGTAGGVAELDEAGKVPASQLPSFVDDVVEYPSLAQFPSTGESGKIYVSTSNNTAYRWSGTQYVPIGGSLTLGETSATAYRGDRGSAAFSHALAKGSAYAKGLYKIRTNAEGHVIEATAVTKQDIVDLGIPGTSVDPSTLIDDTTPAANKVYSSNKVEAELAPVKNALTSKQDAPTSGEAAGKLLGLAMVDNKLVPVWSSLPVASTEQDGYGVIRVNANAGIGIYDGYLYMLTPNDDTIKGGTNGSTSIKPSIQHKSVFIGLAKAAGYDLKDVQNLTFGTYPDEAINAILSMLGVYNRIITPESGNTFTLLPCPFSYNFGEKATLTVTVTATTQYHFMFESPSGSACVLTMNGITGTAGDTIEAGKAYEVDVWAGIALIKKVEVTQAT